MRLASFALALVVSAGLVPGQGLRRAPGFALPTTDGRELRLPRYTEPDKEQLLLLSRLDLKLPPQPRPELLDKKPTMTKLKMNV